ncbi:unnamed protein product, partial [Cladocopium goreaui]
AIHGCVQRLVRLDLGSADHRRWLGKHRGRHAGGFSTPTTAQHGEDLCGHVVGSGFDPLFLHHFRGCQSKCQFASLLRWHPVSDGLDQQLGGVWLLEPSADRHCAAPAVGFGLCLER